MWYPSLPCIEKSYRQRKCHNKVSWFSYMHLWQYLEVSMWSTYLAQAYFQNPAPVRWLGLWAHGQWLRRWPPYCNLLCVMRLVPWFKFLIGGIYILNNISIFWPEHKINFILQRKSWVFVQCLHHVWWFFVAAPRWLLKPPELPEG